MCPIIQVLMSTYNGEKYLQEQLESILAQKDVFVKVLIRDDGSTDHTTQILKQYEKNSLNINVIYGENVGYKKSFFELLKKSDKNTHFFAFADQDDIWLEKKLINAIEKIKNETKPILYQSYATYVDEYLNPINYIQEYRMPTSINDAVLNIWSHGCTMVFNDILRNYAIEYLPDKKMAHDKWLALIAYFCGEYIFDENSYILYRQHRDNVTNGAAMGKGNNSFPRVIKKIDKFLRGKYFCNYGKNLYDGMHKYLSNEIIYDLQRWSVYKDSISSKWRLICDKTVSKKTVKGTLLLKIAILFSIY